MMDQLHSLTYATQQRVLACGAVKDCPRIILDAWASLYRWHVHGQQVASLTADRASELLDCTLPPDLPLATSPLKEEAVAYQLPEPDTWIIVARHAPSPSMVAVTNDVRWVYAQPLLTYLTIIDNTMACGFISLADMPTPASLILHPGSDSGHKELSPVDISEEEYRFSLALTAHYQGSSL